MAIPFNVHPVRRVPSEPAETKWIVQIHRAGAWPGWRWMDRVMGLNWVGELGVIPLLIMPLAIPSIVARRLKYWLARRSDWEVLVYAGAALTEDYRPSLAVLVENWPGKAEAASRAEEVCAHLLRFNGLPSPTA